MTKWLVTGAGGQVGSQVIELLGEDEVVALGHADLDITDALEVRRAIDTHRPDVVVNAAAYTAVDAAEEDELAAAAVNHLGPENLARALAHAETGRLLHVSTDYVF